ncbi:MAG: TIGR03862 family flavoprotein [Parvibaculum sp.]
MNEPTLHSRASRQASSIAAIIGGGPAGLMAAEQLATQGIETHVFDAMPSFGRKFLLAGKSGLNLTHSEAYEQFVSRFGAAAPALGAALSAFTPDMLRQWVHELGVETFIGTSGRVFPRTWKASPLLRAWLRRLAESGVRFHTRHRWLGWTQEGALRFATVEGETTFTPAATILALGGASWPRLGADGAWTTILAPEGLPITPLEPANCGFDVAWSDHLRTHFAGTPVKPVTLHLDGEALRGEFVVTSRGVEGSAIYALSAKLREKIKSGGSATVMLDLAPDRSLERLCQDLSRPRGKHSLASHLRKSVGIEGVKAALLREAGDIARLDMLHLAAAIKSTPLTLLAPHPLERAISTAGGLDLAALDSRYMVILKPGLFCAGEMLDWEAPTGGYLITACMATGRAAGRGAASYMTAKD